MIVGGKMREHMEAILYFVFFVASLCVTTMIEIDIQFFRMFVSIGCFSK